MDRATIDFARRRPAPSRLSDGAARRMLVTRLVAAEGGTSERWHDLIGAIVQRPALIGPRGNWEVRPAGTARERAAIERAADMLRREHPHLSWET